MRVSLAIRRLLRDFGDDERGSFAIITGAILTVVLLSVGFAVNLAQLHQVKSNLGNALDAAVTSTARDLTTGKVKPENARALVETFLEANSKPELVASGRLFLDEMIVDQSARTVEATAHVDVDLFFPLFSSGDTQRVNNISAAVYTDKQIEVAMMLDVTGSMAKKGKTDKIGDLIDAATNAVTTMMANQDPKNPRIRLALVPYASGVNTGALLNNVYAEKSSGSDLPPAADDPIFGGKKDKPLPAFGDYLAAVKSNFPYDDNCATERKDKDGNPDFSADGPNTVRTNKKGKKYYALVNRDNNLSGSGMNKCPDAKIVPLTADSDTLIDSIETYKANGYTAGAIAIQWTYYMLSPKWRDAIKAAKLGDGPADHAPSKISKVAILMTDGQFNTAYAGVGKNFNSQDSKTRQNAEKICTNMKDDGIEVYTIGFDLDNKDMTKDQRDAAKGVLKKCASKDVSSVTHYFETSTGEELNAAFLEIIGNTERIALTQ